MRSWRWCDASPSGKTHSQPPISHAGRHTGLTDRGGAWGVSSWWVVDGQASVLGGQGRHHVQRHGRARAGGEAGSGGGAAAAGGAGLVLRDRDQVPGTQGRSGGGGQEARQTGRPPACLPTPRSLTHPPACLQYVVFPGNVGDGRALLEAVYKLRAQQPPPPPPPSQPATSSSGTTSSSSSPSSPSSVGLWASGPAARASRTLDILTTGR